MAKKTARIILKLECVTCKSQNYRTEKNKTTTTEKLLLKKYCARCRKHTEHKEIQKLK